MEGGGGSGGGALTCIACASTFESLEEQKAHFRLDWHRYNLKRKVAGLGPSTREEFDRRLAATLGAGGGSSAKPEGPPQRCDLCRKFFSSPKLLEQHFLTKKHKQAEKEEKEKKKEASRGAESQKIFTAGEDAGKAASAGQETAGGDGDSPPRLDPEICVFCDRESKDAAENCEHMLKRHGFFIPDAEYLVDLDGLISYCAEKVKVGCMCLYCNDHGKAYLSARAVQQHMVDVGHCKLRYEEGEDLHEFEVFYDFSQTYADMHVEDEENSDVRDAIRSNYGAVSFNHLGELELPNGRVCGHRQYKLYYDQNLSDRPLGHSSEKKDLLRLGIGAARPQSSGTAGGHQSSLIAREPAKMGGIGDRNSMQMLRRVQREQAKHSLRLAISQNKLNKTFDRIMEC